MKKKLLNGKPPKYEMVPIVVEGFKRDEHGGKVSGILRLAPALQPNDGSGSSNKNANSSDNNASTTTTTTTTTTSTTSTAKDTNVDDDQITVIGRSNKGLIEAMINYLQTVSPEDLNTKKLGVVGKHTVGRLKRWVKRIIELHKMSKKLPFNDNLLNRYGSLKALEKHASDVEDTVLTMLIDLVKLWGDGTCRIYMFNLLQIT